MVKIKYNNLAKIFIIRGEKFESVKLMLEELKTNIKNFDGSLFLEKRLSHATIFLVICFKDDISMRAYESVCVPKVKGMKISDIISSRLVQVSGDMSEVSEKIIEIRESLHNYNGVILKEQRISDTDYVLLLFFTDDEKMKIWEDAYGVKN